MQTHVENWGDITVVKVSGRLDIDKTPLFKQACLKVLKHQKVIFSLQGLNFVGSTGIQNFFQAINEIGEKNENICKIVGLNADFKRLVPFVQGQSVQIHESLEAAQFSFQNPHVTISPNLTLIETEPVSESEEAFESTEKLD